MVKNVKKNMMLDKDALAIEKLRISCNLKLSKQNKESSVTQKNESKILVSTKVQRTYILMSLKSRYI